MCSFKLFSVASADFPNIFVWYLIPRKGKKCRVKFCNLAQSLKVNSGFRNHCPSSMPLKVWFPIGSIRIIWEHVRNADSWAECKSICNQILPGKSLLTKSLRNNTLVDKPEHFLLRGTLWPLLVCVTHLKHTSDLPQGQESSFVEHLSCIIRLDSLTLSSQ